MSHLLATIDSIHRLRPVNVASARRFSGPGTKYSTMLSLLRWNISDRRGKYRMPYRINRSVLYRGTRRVVPKKVVGVPISRWPDRPQNKSAAAIRTDIV